MAARKIKTPVIDIQARPGLPLGMPAATFLRDYWQKRPLLIRGAFPDFETPVQPEDLAGLACEEGALSRLITHDRATDGWSVRTGPFQEEEFPGMPDHDWTLLVQDVDKWDADVRALISHFDFLPRWRMDDVMISFAATGGSVGAHVDQYDVFLLQAYGHRRWQIDASESIKGKRPPLDFRDDVELKLLRRFKPTHDWVLAPGDMLYLPPNVPHNGVAEDPCLTFSFGMRAPASAELISDYLDTHLPCRRGSDGARRTAAARGDRSRAGRGRGIAAPPVGAPGLAPCQAWRQPVLQRPGLRPAGQGCPGTGRHRTDRRGAVPEALGQGP